MTPDTVRELIRGDALELYGQPKWTFGKNTCNTYEVFVEKVHLSEDILIPAWPILELIERDEELTSLFSRWILKAAIASVMDLTERTDSNLTLSLNLLPHHANQGGFYNEVAGQLEQSGFDPKRIQFELSEAQNLSALGVENLNRLHDEFGIGLWLANFGTGYANVDLLREVHFDGIELDRSYAARVPEHEQTCRLVVAIQHMAHTLDLQICAKGIETQDQFEFFEELGVFKGQGYLIGRPMPLNGLGDYIETYSLHRGHV